MTQPLRSIRAKLIESVREYCAEHFLRPYIWVDVDDACLVPFEYVTEGMIILDVDDEAVRGLELTDELLTFDCACGPGGDAGRRRFLHGETHASGFARGNSW